MKILGCLLLAIAALVIISKDYEVPRPENWPKNTRKYYNPVTGYLRVVDAESGITLFRYYDDTTYNPTHLEKNSKGEWQVTFSPRPDP